jgi:hypothetical protein
LDKLSPSSKLALTDLNELRISIKMPIIYENIKTPNSNSIEPNALSKSFTGLKSPSPTVESDVKAKYVIPIALYIFVFYKNP